MNKYKKCIKTFHYLIKIFQFDFVLNNIIEKEERKMVILN